MNGNTVLTVAVIGGVVVVGYLLYKHYNPTTNNANNTVLTDVGFGLNALPGVVNAAQSIFGSSGGSSGVVGGYDDASDAEDAVG